MRRQGAKWHRTAIKPWISYVARHWKPLREPAKDAVARGGEEGNHGREEREDRADQWPGGREAPKISSIPVQPMNTDPTVHSLAEWARRCLPSSLP